jgi:SAM-dependent methyltransferase
VSAATAAYEQRLRAECVTFADQVNIHDALPPAFHHWSERHVRPKLRALGVDSLTDFFVDPLVEQASRLTRDAVVLSIGSGNGEQELGWLEEAARRGATNLRLRLLEINPSMQRRAAGLAEALGLADRVELVEADFNTWTADAEHDVVIANQALHHVTELEHLYRELHAGLSPSGVLLVSDIIGRNGHRRWPEALEVVERLWATLPPHLRRNAITGEVDEAFPDLDCSDVGFEGIRAQDVLPLLLDTFHPELFLGFANVADPFMDRVYGANFDLGTPSDLRFVDQLGVLDDVLIDAGVLTPTHLVATFRTEPAPLRYHGTRSPSACLRDPGVLDPAGRVSFQPGAADPRGVLGRGAAPAGRINGVMHDGWAGRVVELPVYVTRGAHVVRLELHVPDGFPIGRLRLSVDGETAGVNQVRPGLRRYDFPVHLPARRAAMLRLDADWSATPRGDVRELSYVLRSVDLLSQEAGGRPARG